MNNNLNILIEKVPQFWQGFFASILAAIFIAIVVKFYALFSTRAQVSQKKKLEQLEELETKISSPDSVLRVEGYFQFLFKLLQYLFLASIIWVLASILSYVSVPVMIPCALLSIFFFYLGLGWIYRFQDILRGCIVPSKQIGQTGLVIHSALYGIKGEGNNITDLLRSQISNGKIKILVSNDLSGNPFPGIKKELTVNYSFDGETHSRTIREGEVLTLP